MLNWQIGKKYRCRNGVVVTLIRRDNICNGNSVWDELLYFDQGVILFAKNGKAWQDHVKTDSENDIIEEVVEEKMKIEVGKYYKSKRVNDKIHIVHYNDRGNPSESFYLDAWGNKYYEYEVDKFIGEEWKEPKSGIRYLNIYDNPNARAYSYMTKDEADKTPSVDTRIACIRVEWKEGQFDD